jgi:non-specific serine/threonine protein kinase
LAIYAFDDAIYDAGRKELRVANRLVDVERLPLEVLQVLLSRPGEVVTKTELRDQVWGGRETVDNVINNAVAKLRAALGDVEHTRIVTVPRAGYRLDAVVRSRAPATPARPLARDQLRAGVAVPGRPNFVLRECLGERNNGSVWIADHEKLRERRVFKFALDGDALDALKREFAIGRVLKSSLGEVPSLAQVLEVNLVQPPFFIEFAYGGQDLLRWADAGHLGALDRNGRLELFLEIARTVAAAHEAGVLHKDLKPSNVLVRDEGGRWRARLIDFGSGRLLSPQALERLQLSRLQQTHAQNLLASPDTGTALYLAPELLAGAAPTIKSDLYALGLMLYQVLSGDLRRPLASGWDREIDDPLLREDIFAATQGRPDDRPSSVAAWCNALADLDRRREQARQADLLRAEEALAAQRAQRNRWIRPWASTAFGLLLLGLLSTSWQWHRAVSERDAAARANRQAGASLAFLVEDVLELHNPYAGRRAKPRTVLEALSAAEATIGQRFGHDPAMEGEVRLHAARLFVAYEQLPRAEAQLRLAAEKLVTTRGVRDPQAMEARLRRAAVLARMSQPGDAQQALEELDRDAADALRRHPWLAAMRDLAAASVHSARYEVTQALPLLDRGLEAARQLQPRDEALLDHAWGETLSRHSAGGNHARALALAEEWIKDIEARPPSRQGALLQAQARHGEALINADRLAEGTAVLREVAPRLSELLGAASIPAFLAHNMLCDVHGQAKRWDEAATCLQGLLDRSLAQGGLQERFELLSRLNVALYRHAGGNYALADETFSAVLPRLENLDWAGPVRAMALFAATHSRLRLGQWQAAAQMRQDIDLAAAQRADPSRAWQARLLVLDGLIAERSGRLAEARQLLQSAMTAYEDFARERKATKISESYFVDGKAAIERLERRSRP